MRLLLRESRWLSSDPRHREAPYLKVVKIEKSHVKCHSYRDPEQTQFDRAVFMTRQAFTGSCQRYSLRGSRLATEL